MQSWVIVLIVVAAAAAVLFVIFGRDKARRIGAPRVEEADKATASGRPAEAQASTSTRNGPVEESPAGGPAGDPLPSDDEIWRELAAGRKIMAIKLVRERTGLGLNEAKDYVERLEVEAKRDGRLPR